MIESYAVYAIHIPSVVGMEREQTDNSSLPASTLPEKRGTIRKAVDDDSIKGTLIVRLVMSIDLWLSTPLPAEDELLRCGQACLSTLYERPDISLELARQKLHTWPYKDVPVCWRRMYEDAALRCLVKLPLNENFIDEAVRLLDTAIHLTGAPARSGLIQDVFDEAEKIMGNIAASEVPEQFCISVAREFEIRHPIPQYAATLSFETFQAHLDQLNTPLIMSGATSHWPAMQNWTSPSYWLKRTLGGRRLVPVEIGRQYTDDSWSQQILPFKEFLTNYVLEDYADTGYLAQYDLFAQIPKLRGDINVPDYCYCSPPKPQAAHSHVSQGGDAKGSEDKDEMTDPLVNLWLGPSGTKTPLHTDPYSNILCQVMGYKYVRLYAPSESEKLYPMGVDDNGVDMSNTASVDVKLARGTENSLKGEQQRDRFPLFEQAEFVEGIIRPGDCLYIPRGWWHYVEGLSVGASVSFWWNE
jgi:hypothetical protein